MESTLQRKKPSLIVDFMVKGELRVPLTFSTGKIAILGTRRQRKEQSFGEDGNRERVSVLFWIMLYLKCW